MIGKPLMATLGGSIKVEGEVAFENPKPETRTMAEERALADLYWMENTRKFWDAAARHVAEQDRIRLLEPQKSNRPSNFPTR